MSGSSLRLLWLIFCGCINNFNCMKQSFSFVCVLVLYEKLSIPSFSCYFILAIFFIDELCKEILAI